MKGFIGFRVRGLEFRVMVGIRVRVNNRICGPCTVFLR